MNNRFDYISNFKDQKNAVDEMSDARAAFIKIDQYLATLLPLESLVQVRSAKQG